MKKICILFFLGVLATINVKAQNELAKNKNGVILLPEVGDWAIGADAAPMLNWAGNLFNSSQGNNVNFDFLTTDQTIFAKRMANANTAHRARARIGFSSVSGGTTDSSTVTSNFNFIVGAGLEKRKGNRRLQGIYGAEALIGMSAGGQTTEITVGNQKSTSEINNGFGLTLGVRGFIGVEYFVFPKLSVGGEFGWGPSLVVQGESTAQAGGTETVLSASQTSFTMDNDNANGTIALFFYF